MSDTFYQYFFSIVPAVVSIILLIGIVYRGFVTLNRRGGDFEWVDENGRRITVRHKNIRLQLCLKPYKTFKNRFSPDDYARFSQQVEEINSKERAYLNRYGSFADYVEWVNSQFSEMKIPLSIENDTTSSFEYDGVIKVIETSELLPDENVFDWKNAFTDDTLNEDQCTAEHFLIRPFEHFEAVFTLDDYEMFAKFTRLTNAILERNLDTLGQAGNTDATEFYDIVFLYLHAKTLNFERDFICNLDAMRCAFDDFQKRKTAEEFERFQQSQ